MTKKELEQEVLTLENHIETCKNASESYQQELVVAQKTLADINKPELTPMQFDDIYKAVEEIVGEFHFSDSDNYEVEFNLDYDNRITLSSINLRNYQDLVPIIVEQVSKLFTEVECPVLSNDTDEIK